MWMLGNRLDDRATGNVKKIVRSIAENVSVNYGTSLGKIPITFYASFPRTIEFQHSQPIILVIKHEVNKRHGFKL